MTPSGYSLMTFACGVSSLILVAGMWWWGISSNQPVLVGTGRVGDLVTALICSLLLLLALGAVYFFDLGSARLSELERSGRRGPVLKSLRELYWNRATDRPNTVELEDLWALWGKWLAAVAAAGTSLPMSVALWSFIWGGL